MQQATTIPELLRLPSPAPRPQALAFDGESLWMGSLETQRVYRIDPQHFTLVEEVSAPGSPIGMVSTGDDLRVLCSENPDDQRVIRRLVPGRGFKDHERIACPDDTGSFLAYDGTNLWVSQRHNKRVLEIDGHGTVLREMTAPMQITGVTWCDDYLYLSLWGGDGSAGSMIGRMRAGDAEVEMLGMLSFQAISLTGDRSRFWTNDRGANEIVAFTL